MREAPRRNVMESKHTEAAPDRRAEGGHISSTRCKKNQMNLIYSYLWADFDFYPHPLKRIVKDVWLF